MAALIFCASPVAGQGILSFSCPTGDDLEHGIVLTDPARKGEIHERYRQLDGPFFGVSSINGIFLNGVTVSYSGLFTYKHWFKGKVVQYEEPTTDLSALLRFEAGTEHKYESERFNPKNPARKWLISATYFIEDADDFQLGDCIYPALRIRREGTLTMPDGRVKADKEDFTFLPELRLRVAGTGIYYGDVSDVRNRNILDAREWPFTADAADVLNK